MRSILLALIVFYRKCLSPLKPSCCRFTPTCSQYAAEAVLEHGPLWGFLLAVWRILRCHPFTKGGYDPVPTVPPFGKPKASKPPWKPNA